MADNINIPPFGRTSNMSTEKCPVGNSAPMGQGSETHKNVGGADVYMPGKEGHCPKSAGEVPAPPGPKKM